MQEANIAYPAIANLLVKVAVLASKVGKGLNQLCCGGMKRYRIGLSNLKQIALYYFMPDAQSLPMMLNTHEYLFGKGLLASVATDKGYYSLSNEQLLIEKASLKFNYPVLIGRSMRLAKQRYGQSGNYCIIDVPVLSL